jgi:ABC-type sugar transport system ATPase subunit
MSGLASPNGAADAIAMSPRIGDPHLELSGIHKRFGGVRALRGANLKISSQGVIHGLMGENGSGKSTLLGVLSGQLQPDEGQISVGGVPVSFANPTAALRGGIAMVSQESALASELTIAENIFLGRRMERRFGGINWRATRLRAAEVLERLELAYDPAWPVHRLRPDQRQMVEIARALSMETRVLILDEPTSSLTDDEVQALFRAVRQIKTTGVATIFVSHRFNEVFDLVDELTVLRDGGTAAEGSVGDFDPRTLVDAMVGKEGAWKDYARPVRTQRTQEATVPALTVEAMTIPGRVFHADLEVAPGEILGVAGLVGAGRSELLEGIFGLRPVTEGVIRVAGSVVNARSPRAAIQQGLGFLPPDRKSQGLVLQRTIDENLTMVATLTRSRFRRPGGVELEAKVTEIARAMHLRASSHQALVSTLSGGNQQKVAVGKWLMADPRVLLLDEPTRGVDVAAKSEIHELLRAVAARGVGMLVVSSENDELIELCDRIVVMFRGRIVASMTSEEADEPTIARLAGGHQ